MFLTEDEILMGYKDTDQNISGRSLTLLIFAVWCTSSVGEHLSVRLITLSVNSSKRLMQFLVKLDGSPLKK